MGGRRAAASHAAAGLFALAAYGSPAESLADETLLLFSGTDVWAHGAFLHGGAVWAPAGLNRDGLLFKALIRRLLHVFLRRGRHGNSWPRVRGAIHAGLPLQDRLVVRG